MDTPTQGPARELYWHEKDADQKIQKLSEGIRYLSHCLQDALKTIEQLKNHSHAGNIIVTPMCEQNHGYRDGVADSYFFKNPLGISPEFKGY